MSNDSVISVENLGKRYRIGVARKRAQNLREALKRLPLAPFRYLQTRLRGATDEETLWALKDVSFEVKQGEVLGVIGRNGAGKSTLLKILSRITDPTEGHALIRGRVNSLLEVGTGFHPELTGRDNVFMNAAMHGMKRREIVAKMDEIIAFAEVEKFIDTPVKFYSSGMYVRLAFAVAAHLEPDILIVDEVLAVGDMNFQKKCMGKMGEVSHQGRTVLIVSHNMPIVTNLCTRAILMKDGGIMRDATPPEVIPAYIALAGGQAGGVRWDDAHSAPGDQTVRMRSVRILQEGFEGACADVDIGREINIEITYEVLEEGARLYPAIWLKDDMGTPVLSSDNAKGNSCEDDPWYGRPLSRGIYKATCLIPAFFLNDKSYSITAIVGRLPHQAVVLLEDVVTFRVHDSGGMRKDYFGRWLGAVRPRLRWSTTPEGVCG